LPLTPSGKLDRRALPEPDHLRPELEQEFVAPRTERERILAEIWADVLGVEQVGIYDNFFDLGGDSIRATQAAARIRAAYGRNFPVIWFFETPTVSELAARALEASLGDLTDLPVPTRHSTLDELLARVDEMTEAEVDVLLSQFNAEN
jgi:hypothetical protein